MRFSFLVKAEMQQTYLATSLLVYISQKLLQRLQYFLQQLLGGELRLQQRLDVAQNRVTTLVASARERRGGPLSCPRRLRCIRIALRCPRRVRRPPLSTSVTVIGITLRTGTQKPELKRGRS